MSEKVLNNLADIKIGRGVLHFASELRARWDGALEKVVAIERRIEELRAVAAARPRIDRMALMRLAQDLPAAWNAPTTDTRTRQRLIHILTRLIPGSTWLVPSDALKTAAVEQGAHDVIARRPQNYENYQYDKVVPGL